MQDAQNILTCNSMADQILKIGRVQVGSNDELWSIRFTVMATRIMTQITANQPIDTTPIRAIFCLLGIFIQITRG